MTNGVRVAVAAAALFLAGWFVRPATSAPAAAPRARAQAQTWEYASLIRSDKFAALNLPDRIPKSTTMPELYRELGGKQPDDHLEVTDVLTQLGAEGWELAAVTTDRGAVVFFLKRPK